MRCEPRPTLWPDLDVDVVGQAEHSLGDDVALHLARAAADGERLGEQEAACTTPRSSQVGLGLVGAQVAAVEPFGSGRHGSPASRRRR